MPGISDKTFQEIISSRIEPAPKWRFVLRHASIWALLALAVTAGALAVSAGAFLMSDFEWDVSSYPEGGLWLIVLRSVPFFWLGALVLLLIVAYMEYRRTRLGYRGHTSAIVAVCLLISVSAGAILHLAGVGETIEDAAARSVPFYENVVWHKDDLWTLPDEGLLAGTVTSVNSSDDDVIVKDFTGGEWHVDATAAAAGGAALKTGDQVKITGERRAGDGFHAKKINTWKGKKHGRVRPGSLAPDSDDSAGLHGRGAAGRVKNL